MSGIRLPKHGFAISSLTNELPTDVDSVASGVTKFGQQVGRTGKQLAKIASDIQRAGETTERLGKLLSK